MNFIQKILCARGISISALILFFHVTTIIIAQPGNEDIRKHIDTIHSEVLKEDRFVWVHLPAKASFTKTFPVVYVLDAEANFNTTVEILHQLSKRTGNSIFAQTIVIGVGNIWLRDRDYTPTHIISSPFVDSMAAKKSGGGENFILFMEKELIPYVNTKYSASPSRVLIGHSLGGLTVMNIMLNHTKLFNGYAAIDPAMWWDDQKLLKQSKTILSEDKFENVSLFLAIANTMNKEMNDISEIKKDTSKRTDLIRPGVALADQLGANTQNKLRFNWKYYKEQHHMSVYPFAESDALEFLFSFPSSAK